MHAVVLRTAGAKGPDNSLLLCSDATDGTWAPTDDNRSNVHLRGASRVIRHLVGSLSWEISQLQLRQCFECSSKQNPLVKFSFKVFPFQHSHQLPPIFGIEQGFSHYGVRKGQGGRL